MSLWDCLLWLAYRHRQLRRRRRRQGGGEKKLLCSFSLVFLPLTKLSIWSHQLPRPTAAFVCCSIALDNSNIVRLQLLAHLKRLFSISASLKPAGSFDVLTFSLESVKKNIPYIYIYVTCEHKWARKLVLAVLTEAPFPFRMNCAAQASNCSRRASLWVDR